MVSSYYNPLSYSQKHTAPNLTYPSAPHQPWFSTNYHPAAAANNQFLSSMDPQHHQPMYYNPHMFHQTAAAADLYAARENFQNLSAGGPLSVAHSQMFSTLPHNQQQQQHINNNNNGSHQNHQQQQQNHHHQQQHNGHNSNGSTGGNSPLDETSSSADLLTDGIPSPPITNLSSGGGGGPGGGGSEISSPGIPNASSSPQISINGGQQPTPSSSPYRYEWMKKPAYASQPNPGKTRTKDKYRVVYTDFQRLELEKEYHTSRYITIRRKTELAQGLQLSERQVKIWFQNRRAKERKQTKKRDDSGSSINSSNGSVCINGQNNNGITSATSPDELVNFMEPKPPKLESGLHHHLSHQHSFHHHHHQMMAATGMPSSMSGLQALHHHHGHLAAVAAAASGNSSSPVTLPSQHMQHVYQQMSGIETIS